MTGCQVQHRQRCRPRVVTLTPPHKIGLLLQNHAKLLKRFQSRNSVTVVIPKKNEDKESPITIEGADDDVVRCVAQMMAEIHGLKVEVGDFVVNNVPEIDEVHVRLDGQKPSQLAAAYSSLAQSCAPTTITVPSTGKLAIMYAELQDRRMLQGWADKLKVHVDVQTHNGAPTQIRVFGSGHVTGSFFKEIGDYCDGFEKRYLFHALKADVACLFRPNRIGDVRRKALSKSFPDYTIKFSPSPPGVELAWPPEAPGEAVSKLKNEANKILQELGHELQKDSRNPHTCMWCKKEGTKLRLSMCGHGFCIDCVEAIAIQNASSGHGGVVCKMCDRGKSLVLPYDIKRAMGPKRYEEYAKKVTVALIKAGRSVAHGLDLCPNPACGAITASSAGYSVCTSCLVESCSRCNVFDNLLHKDRKCAEYQAELKHRKMQGAFFHAIEKGAEEFVRMKWTAAMPRVVKVMINPALNIKSNAPSLCMFRAGLTAARCSTDSDRIDHAGHFAWHGTSEMAVPLICHGGFDPLRRSGQACGRGEYFGQSPEVSKGYCGGGSEQMIVTFLLNGAFNTKHGTFCYVVDNPLDKSKAFCMPVAVVCFGSTSPSFITPPSAVAAAAAEDEIQLGVAEADDQTLEPMQCLFRWQWEQDGGCFEAYTDEINVIVERAYDERQRTGKLVIRTPKIRRYNDDQPQEYDIDFGRSKQINVKTGYNRGIRRRQVDILLTGKERWCYQAVNGPWRYFDSMAQGPIMEAYKAYTKGTSLSQVTITFPGSPDTYTLDFAENTQTNRRTGTRRNIALRE